MIVPPPFVIQQRAWECAWMLLEAYPHRMALEDRVRATVIVNAEPLGWAECQWAFRMYVAVAEIRI